jgi:hypothetical protein
MGWLSCCGQELRCQLGSVLRSLGLVREARSGGFGSEHLQNSDKNVFMNRKKARNLRVCFAALDDNGALSPVKHARTCATAAKHHIKSARCTCIGVMSYRVCLPLVDRYPSAQLVT